jgi:putative oxidoreductase
MSASIAVAQAKPSEGRSKALHVALWVAQVLLFAAFGMAGFMKLTTPIPDLAQKMAWVTAVPHLVRFIGAAELAGALGMLLPSITRIRPGLTALAGLGLTTIMILAMAFHVSRGEASVTPANLVLGGLAAFVAWGRFRKAPIEPRA